MHVNAHLDLDVVAIEQADEVTLMLELDAPPAPDSRRAWRRSSARAATS